MRVGFRDRPYDLFLTAGLGIVLAPILALGSVGVLGLGLSVAFVLILPGYALSTAIFPRDGEVPWIERIALSVGLGIALVAMIGFALDATPWGVRPGAFVLAILAATLALCAAGYARRMRLHPAERLAFGANFAMPRWRGTPPVDQALALGLAAALVAALAFAVTSVPAPTGSRFTEFYMLDPNGGTVTYPTQLNATESGTILVVVANHEGRTVNYTVLARLVAVKYVYNQTTGQNDTLELWNATLGTWPVNLADAALSKKPFAFSIATVGLYQVRLLLFVGPPQGAAYRYLRLPVQVV